MKAGKRLTVLLFLLTSLVSAADTSVIYIMQPRGSPSPSEASEDNAHQTPSRKVASTGGVAPGGGGSMGQNHGGTRGGKPTVRCAVTLPRSCFCSKSEGALSINCSNVHLTTVPRQWVDEGPAVFKTLNLERNRIREINDGDFFGVKIERLLLANNSLSELKFLSFWGLEYSLETLDLSYNHFRKVPSEALRLLRNLRTLSLTGNQISSLHDFDFGYMRKLEVLALDKNPISAVSRQSLVGTQIILLTLDYIRLKDQLEDLTTDEMKYVKGLSLAHNKIRSIPGEWFRNVKYLRYLNLGNNLLSTVAATSFVGLEDPLRTLELHHNHLTQVPTDALRRLTHLETLDLSHNRIRRVYRRAFNASTALQALDLKHNRIHKLSKRAFVGLDSIQKLDLRHNYLITLDDRTFPWSHPKGRFVYLADNPWLCNCIIRWIKDEMDAQSDLSTVFADDVVCDRPQPLHGLPIAKVPDADISCDHDYYYYYEDKEAEGEEEATDEDDTGTDDDEDTVDGGGGGGGHDDDHLKEDDHQTEVEEDGAVHEARGQRNITRKYK